MAVAGICWDFFFCGVYTAACKIAGQGEWRLLGFAGISSFAVSTAAWQTARKKQDFWVGKIIFLKLEKSDCRDLLGFLLFCVAWQTDHSCEIGDPYRLSKRLVVLAYIGGLSFLFFWGVGGTWWHGPSTC